MSSLMYIRALISRGVGKVVPGAVELQQLHRQLTARHPGFRPL